MTKLTPEVQTVEPFDFVASVSTTGGIFSNADLTLYRDVSRALESHGLGHISVRDFNTDFSGRPLEDQWVRTVMYGDNQSFRRFWTIANETRKLRKKLEKTTSVADTSTILTDRIEQMAKELSEEATR